MGMECIIGQEKILVSNIFKYLKSLLCFQTGFFLLTHYQTTNSRLLQTERVCRQHFQIWRKWQKVIQTGRKHCRKRRNCSLREISPIPTVFSKACFPGSSNGAIVWKWVNPFPNKPWFLRVCSTSLLKTLWEKEKLLVMSNFSFSNIVFCPFWELSVIFIKFKIVIWKLFQFGCV